MSVIYLVRTEQGLMPASEADWDLLQKYPLGSFVKIKLTRVRNYHHLKKYMVLMTMAFENQERYSDFKAFRNAVKIACGWFVPQVLLNGAINCIPTSLSFESMDQDEFEQHYQDAIRVLLREVLVNWDNEDVRRCAEHIARA